MIDPLILVADESLDPAASAELVQRMAAAGLRRVWLRVDQDQARRQLAKRWRSVWPHRLTIGNDPDLAGDGVGLHDAARISPRTSVPRPYSRSAHDSRELDVAEACGCDYAVFGTVWRSVSHPGRKGCGLESFSGFAARSSIPLFAIGGVTPERTGFVRQAGGAGVVVRSGLLAAKDPALAVRAYLEAWSSVISTDTTSSQVDDSSASGTVQTA